MKDAAILGAAGIAAGIAATDFLNSGIVPGEAMIAVTGASCDTGVVAATLMALLGYDVAAYIVECEDGADYVKGLGVKEVKKLSELEKPSKELLYEPVYSAAFDNTGGMALTNLLKYMKPKSTVAVGGAYSDNVNSSLAPFFFRGVNITGINALYCSTHTKLDIWRKLSGDWKIPNMDWLSTEISFDEIPEQLPALLDGRTKGRIIINHSL
jgi:alcohol dehydrogenase